MKLAFLMFTFIWGSLSYRSPNVENCVRDYEFGFGMQNEHYIIDILAERENGMYYRGGKFNVIPVNWMELEYFCKEARHIDSESMRLLYRPFKEWWLLDPFSIGGSVNMQSWKDTKYLLAMTYRTKHIQFCYETNFIDRIVVSLKTGFDIPMGKNFVTQLLHRYEAINDNNFDQEKTVIGWRKKE